MAPSGSLRRVVPPPLRRWAKSLAGMAGAGFGLSRIAAFYGTDKVQSGYLPHYEHHLGHLRRRRMTLLEIGVLDGASVKAWQAYFARGTIVGMDIEPKRILEPRVRFRQGSQDDAAFLAGVAAELGPFDVVIDDGSHISRHMITSFECLWPHVRPGGWYVIEDIGTSYWPEYEGGEVGRTDTAIHLVKGMVDEVNVSQVRGEHELRRDLAELHVYPSIVFIQKSG